MTWLHVRYYAASEAIYQSNVKPKFAVIVNFYGVVE